MNPSLKHTGSPLWQLLCLAEGNITLRCSVRLIKHTDAAKTEAGIREGLSFRVDFRLAPHRIVGVVEEPGAHLVVRRVVPLRLRVLLCAVRASQHTPSFGVSASCWEHGRADAFLVAADRMCDRVGVRA